MSSEAGPPSASEGPDEPSAQAVGSDDVSRDKQAKATTSNARPASGETHENGYMPEGSEPEKVLRPAGRRSAVSSSVRARTAFIGTTHINSVVIQGQNRAFQVPLTDLVALHGAGPFVEPPGFSDLVTAINGDRVVVCSAPSGSGRDRAVTRALLATQHKTVRMLPTGLTLIEMARAVEAVADEADEIGEKAACVVHMPDTSTLRALVSSSGEPVRATAASGRLTVVAVTNAPADLAVRSTTFPVELNSPPAPEVVSAWARQCSASTEAGQLAQSALKALKKSIGPATAAALVQEVLRDATRTASQVAILFDSSAADAALGDWLAGGRPNAEVAALAAGVTLSGHSADVVQDQVDTLAKLLETTESVTSELAGKSVWPAGLLGLGTERVQTHFGAHAMRTVGVCEPYLPQDFVRAMWESFGERFRIRYSAWLADLPAVPALRWDAAYTAGVLFSVDPVLVESQILRPWALHDRAIFRHCAGVALGAPIAIGADPEPARLLAHQWISGDNVRYQEAAIAAYGGLLGAWDTTSSAPLKLIRIGNRTPRLRPVADGALANLVVAGAEAMTSRSLVLNYLLLLVRDRYDRDRVFACLPVVVGTLLSGEVICRRSLDAIQEEPDNWLALAEIIGCTLTTPSGASAGAAAIEMFVRAAGRGRIDMEVTERVIRDIKKSQQRVGAVRRLKPVLQRELRRLARSRDESTAAVASSLTRQFFG